MHTNHEYDKDETKHWSTFAFIILLGLFGGFLTYDMTEHREAERLKKNTEIHQAKIKASTYEECHRGVTYLTFHFKSGRASVASKTVMLDVNSKIIPCKENK